MFQIIEINFSGFFPGVIPYLPYSKQSKMRNRGAIPAKLIATMLCRAGRDYTNNKFIAEEDLCYECSLFPLFY